MLSVSELRDKLGKFRESDGEYHEYDLPNDLAIENTNRILDQMELHKLDATRIVLSAEGGVGLIWIGEIEPNRYLHIECCNDGAVTGVRSDRHTTLDCRKPSPEAFQFWWIRDLIRLDGRPGYECPGYECPDEGELVLTLDETLEHIRCYIWADYQ